MSLCGTDKRTIEDRATQPLNWKAEFGNISGDVAIQITILYYSLDLGLMTFNWINDLTK